MKGWLKDRGNAVVDNALWWLILATIIATGGSLIAWGGRRTDLPVWAVVLIGAVVLASFALSTAALANLRGLGRRLDAIEAVGPRPAETSLAPHPHAGLLNRIDALDASLKELDATHTAEWVAASSFNSILEDARLARGDSQQLKDMEELDRAQAGYGNVGEWLSVAHSATNGTIRTALGQVRSIVA